MTGSHRSPDDVRRDAAAQRRPVRLTAGLVVLAAVFAVSAVAFGTTRERDIHAGSPAGTVRSFLIATAIDHNGVVGCRYLTIEEQHRLEDAQSPHPSCSIALTPRQLRLGRRTLDDEAAVKGLSYRTRQQGTSAQVTVSMDGASLTFGLHRATASELAEFQPPPTGWRIDSGVEGLTG